MNHVSSQDPIPWLADPLGRIVAIFDQSASMVIHKSHTKNISAHSIDDDVYQKVLTESLENLKNMYGSR